MEQKFKRGNLVKVLVGHQIWSNKTGVSDIAPQNVGRKAIIEYSYSEKYGGGRQSENNSYSIVWADTGSSESWKGDNELELIEEGGEYLISEAKAKREEISKSNVDIKQIIETWAEKEGKLNSQTILFLFDKVGFTSSFLINGEFYVLFADWEIFRPLFNTIMTSKIEQDVIGLLKEDCPINFRDKVIKFFNEVQSIKRN